MGTLWHLYNVHGNFEHLQRHAEVLLRRAGVWPTHGSHGWPGDGRMFSANGARHRSTYANQAINIASDKGSAGAGKTTARLREPAASTATSAAASSAGVSTTVQRAKEQDPYAVYSSALSAHTVQTMVVQQAQSNTVTPSSSASSSPSSSRAKAIKALLQRVKVAYRADYALFAHLAAAKAHPFDASLYFPPIPSMEAQPKSIRSSSSIVEADTGISIHSTGSSDVTSRSRSRRSAVHSDGIGMDGDRRNIGRRPHSQLIDDIRGALARPTSHQSVENGRENELQDDAEMDDDEHFLRVRDRDPQARL